MQPPNPERAAIEARLKDLWGYERLRPGQWELIEAMLQGHDVLGILPTGGGKSLCYQLPAALRQGVTLVISPLIALMQDQVDGLKKRGIEATFINSTLSSREVEQRWTDVEAGRYRLVYVAPERLGSELFLARARRLNIQLVAIDEAHCVSEWGHHFRPAYREIPAIRSLLQGPPFAAFTATATPHVREDIVGGLSLQEPFVHVEGFDRPNIVWSIFNTENKRAQTKDVLEGVEGSGILYASTRRQVLEWHRWLEEEGEAVVAYHGGMDAKDREKALASWVKNDVRLMVATNAFGMGIDKPDVRFVIHTDIPGSLESYYQEAGRAGRDGKRAYAVLLYSRNDEQTQEGLINASHPSYETLQNVYDGVCNLSQLALGSAPDRPISPDPRRLLALTGLYTGQVSHAINLIARAGLWKTHSANQRKAWIRFSQEIEPTRRYSNRVTNPNIKNVMEALLRTLPADIFSDWVECDLASVARTSSLDVPAVSEQLNILASQNMLEWIPPGTGVRIEFLAPRSQRIPIDMGAIRSAKKRALTRLRDMMAYVTGEMCRRRHLLLFFGESAPDRCGKCDVCLDRHQPYILTPDDEGHVQAILEALESGIARSLWPAHLGVPKWKVNALVQAMARRGMVKEDKEGQLEPA